MEPVLLTFVKGTIPATNVNIVLSYLFLGTTAQTEGRCPVSLRIGIHNDRDNCNLALNRLRIWYEVVMKRRLHLCTSSVTHKILMCLPKLNI
jgi:hypothetical protein